MSCEFQRFGFVSELNLLITLSGLEHSNKFKCLTHEYEGLVFFFFSSLICAFFNFSQWRSIVFCEQASVSLAALISWCLALF